jgi:hypothetical protein
MKAPKNVQYKGNSWQKKMSDKLELLRSLSIFIIMKILITFIRFLIQIEFQSGFFCIGKFSNQTNFPPHLFCTKKTTKAIKEKK